MSYAVISLSARSRFVLGDHLSEKSRERSDSPWRRSLWCLKLTAVVMKRVKAFGAHPIYSDVCRMSPEDERTIGCEYVSLDELLSRADIISLHAPLIDSTRGMIGEAQFARMKASAILVNTARGQLVDDKALIKALKDKKLWGAAVDVFEPDEPLFGMDEGLNLIVTPHIGAATYDNYYRGYKLCLENAQRIGRGEAPEFTI